ncbi:molecular chaperone Tir [Gallibacterium genomosp. 3]|uniref:Molecular chaperone Tir n=1 Tax=Gallibacterium genomosp. 3 TaxID=505345 RepID=A0A1A7PQ63_9PAST|nr:molecular chaperone Tir [Gallibacterium genomosp. 3]
MFISYKYSDNSVQQLSSYNTTVRNYVDVLQNILEENTDHINKGEKDDESLDDFKDETIQSKLADKIFDSSVTIVLISPNMKNCCESEKEQWIPWEISYSLRSKKRKDNKSKRNAILLVVLPDSNGCYDYANRTGFYFDIIQKNLNNLINGYPTKKLANGCSQSYMLRCNWDQFISNVNGWIDAAIEINQNGDKYNITTRL